MSFRGRKNGYEMFTSLALGVSHVGEKGRDDLGKKDGEVEERYGEERWGSGGTIWVRDENSFVFSDKVKGTLYNGKASGSEVIGFLEGGQSEEM